MEVPIRSLSFSSARPFLLPCCVFLAVTITILHFTHLTNSADPAMQAEIMSWLFLQVTSLGPHVWQYLNWEHRPEIQSARPIYHSEILRILGILEERLGRPGPNGWITDHGFSIADIVWVPMVDGWKQNRCGIDLGEFPRIREWSDRIYGRETVRRAYETGGLFFGARAGYPPNS